MCTPTIRERNSRDRLRYESDLTDPEQEVVAPFTPPPTRAGRPRERPMHETINRHLVMLNRARAGRDEARPLAAMIDRKKRQDGRGRQPTALRRGQEDQGPHNRGNDRG
jgi:hypothetical protein